MKTLEPDTSPRRERLLLLTLAALGAWSIVLPFLGDAIGVDVNVPLRLEVIDHVVPGLFVLGGTAYAWIRRDTGRTSTDVGYLMAVGIVFLAGLWMVSTHVPLLFEARAGLVAWSGALWHSLPGLPIPLLAAGAYLLPGRGAGAEA